MFVLYKEISADNEVPYNTIVWHGQYRTMAGALSAKRAWERRYKNTYSMIIRDERDEYTDEQRTWSCITDYDTALLNVR
jgi:hypothetical protein